MLHYCILGFTFAFAAVVQPGPFQTFVISQTLSKGWKRTIPAAFAPLISDIPIIILILFLLVNVPLWLINLLQIAGGIFILYLTYRVYVLWKYFYSNSKLQVNDKEQTFIQAVLVNLLNPNPYIGWSLIMGPILIKAWQISPLYGVGFVVSFYLTIVLGLAVTIIIFAVTGKFGTKINRALIGISSIALGLFGIYQLWMGMNEILYK